MGGRKVKGDPSRPRGLLACFANNHKVSTYFLPGDIPNLPRYECTLGSLVRTAHYVPTGIPRGEKCQPIWPVQNKTRTGQEQAMRSHEVEQLFQTKWSRRVKSLVKSRQRNPEHDCHAAMTGRTPCTLAVTSIPGELLSHLSFNLLLPLWQKLLQTPKIARTILAHSPRACNA